MVKIDTSIDFSKESARTPPKMVHEREIAKIEVRTSSKRTRRSPKVVLAWDKRYKNSTTSSKCSASQIKWNVLNMCANPPRH